MARLNPAQHDSIAEQFAELVVDGMDTVSYTHLRAHET